MFQFMFMVQLLVKFRFFSFKSYGKESLYKYCMNVDDGRIMRSWRSCLLLNAVDLTVPTNKMGRRSAVFGIFSDPNVRCRLDPAL